MNAAAANMRTEGAFVVAADPAQAETNQARAISMPLLSAQDASSSSSVSSSNSGKTASRDCFLKATRPTSCPLDLSPTQRKKENRKDRVAARAIKAAELGSAAQLSYQPTNMKRKSIDESADTGAASRGPSPTPNGPKHRRLLTPPAEILSSDPPQNEQAHL